MKLTRLSLLGLLGLLVTSALAAGGLAATSPAAGAGQPSYAYLQQFDRTGTNPLGLVKVPLDNPGQWTDVNGGNLDTLGLDFGPSAQTLYALESGAYGTLDTSTNTFTQLSAADAGPDWAWSGLSVDPWSGAAYGVARPTAGTSPTSSRIFAIPPDGPPKEPPTSVTIGNSDTVLSSSTINCAGQMYVVNRTDSSLYTVDPATGVTTRVGSLGVDPGVQAGLDFDNATGRLYLWTGTGQFGTVDLGNGTFNPIAGGPSGSFEAAIASTCPQPTARITSAADPSTNDATPTLGVATTVGTAQCSFDQGTPSWHPCTTATSDTPATPLADGTWTFRVRSTFRDAQPTATRTFTVDTAAPHTTITAPTQGQVIAGPLVTARLASSEAGSTFRCSLDGGSYQPCVADKSFTLADGWHTLSVKAVDAAGNVDTTPAAVGFRVDSMTPNTTWLTAPAYGAVLPTHLVHTTFTSTETGATFVCSVDGGLYAACSSPYDVSLPDGLHSVQVAAVDQAGNVDPTPATRTFRVDTTPPQTRVTSGPKQHAVVRARTVRFAFTSSEAGSTFRCTLDGKRLARCTSPKTLRLKPGRHVFTVAAIDPSGHRDASPVKRVFRIRR